MAQIITSQHIYIYLYIYAVELKTGPRFPFYKLETGHVFPFFFFIFKNRILPAERRGSLKNKQKQPKKTHCYKLKTGPIMLRNILGPVFNLYLDQFLTYKFVIFCFFCFLGGLKPYFYSVFSKNAKFKETQKRKKTLFVNTSVLTALVKVSVFSAFLIFAVYSISVF